MTKKVRKAVFPAAGLGTRFLPATKAIPKEMLSLVDKPIIQYGVEEAIAAGIEEIIIITGRGKRRDRRPFRHQLRTRRTARVARQERAAGTQPQHLRMAKVVPFAKKRPMGLGHAVLMAKELVGDEPFAVILPDDVIDAKSSCIKQMIDVYNQVQGSVLATMEIEGPAIAAYGVLAGSRDAAQRTHLEAHRHGGEAEV